MDPTTKPALPPKLVLFFGILAVSTASIFIRLAQTEAPSLVIAALRMGLAALVLTPVVLLRRRQELRQLKPADWRTLLFSGFFLALHFAAWITSLELTSIASSVVLVTTTPLWVAIASPLLLHEKITRSLAIGLLLALIGGVITASAQNCGISQGAFSCNFDGAWLQGSSMIGNLLAWLGALFAASYLMVGKKMRGRVDVLVYIYVVYSAAAIFLLIGVFLKGYPLLGYSANFYAYALLLALIPQLIGHSAYNWALGYLPATYVSISLLGEPIGTIILAFLLLRSTPGWLEIGGGLLILTGIALASLDNNRNR